MSDSGSDTTRTTCAGRFEEQYFQHETVYRKFRTPSVGIEMMSHWYGALFRLARGACALDPRGARVLDVGCGYAGMLKLWLGRGARCTGIDVSEYAIEANRRRLPEAQFSLMSVYDLPGESQGRFDLVFCIEVIEHLEDPESAISRLAQATRHGGHLVLTTPNRNMKVPGYRWDNDPTHISVRSFGEWHRLVRSYGLLPVVASSYLTVPLIWRLHPALSIMLNFGRFGPTCVFVLEKT